MMGNTTSLHDCRKTGGNSSVHSVGLLIIRMHKKVVRAVLSGAAIIILCTSCVKNVPIDRFSLVSRHNVEVKEIDSLNSLTVGNGRFAFTVDITGLQSFPEYYAGGVPLGTMSEWGWHSDPNSQNYRLSDTYKAYDVHGREVEYVHRYNDPRDPVRTGASDFFRRNPHRVHLGVIGLELSDSNDYCLGINSIKEPFQKLDLWTGELESRFTVDGVPVNVVTVCHPEIDMISARVVSDLAGSRRARIKISFPVAPDSPSGFGFNYPENHVTTVISEDEGELILRRQMDDDSYFVKIFGGAMTIEKKDDNTWYVEAPQGENTIEFSCLFTQDQPAVTLASFSDTRGRSSEAWQQFWTSGGAVDFSECTDPRASELERRVVLSQYLTRAQCSGEYPAAETGLTYNSWYGKFHLEMHWWHAVHFALWQREEILEKQMDYYFHIYDKALSTANHQGYSGVRWPKMTDPVGDESPSSVGTYLIWQQPHFIYYAELLYQGSTEKESVLRKYGDLVMETAAFMTSYAWYDTVKQKYTLGPVLISAQESLRLETTINPTFELSYWYWGLKTAKEWRERLGLAEDVKMNDVIGKLAAPTVQDGVYLCSEDTRDTWQNSRYMSDHPIISGSLGMIPETGFIDHDVLANSIDSIKMKWNWRSCWGWDFPMLAMSAAAIGRPEQAVDFLLMEAPKNRYLPNGHNYQDTRLTIYLPGNGGLLSAVAMMCTGDRFPQNGQWKVRWENLNTIR